MATHKLQFLTHLITFILLAYSFHFHMRYVGKPYRPGDKTAYGGKSKFLTLWNFLLLTVYFGLAVINDIFGTNERPISPNRSTLQKWRDHIFVSTVFPCSFFVVVIFWSIYAVDRELVFPLVLDKFIPCWLNHVMHTAPLVCILWEMGAVYHEYPRRWAGMLSTVGFLCIYQSWLLWVWHVADFWPYPILNVLNWGQRAVFFVLNWCLCLSIYIVGEYLHKFLWRHERTAAALKLKKKN